ELGPELVRARRPAMLRRPARPAFRRTGVGRILERGLDRCREFFGRGGDAHQVADRDYLRQWRGHDRQAGRHVLVELDRVDALDQRRDLEGNDADRKIPYRFGSEERRVGKEWM